MTPRRPEKPGGVWGIWDVGRKQWMPDPLKGHIDTSPARYKSKTEAERKADRDWRALNPGERFEVRPLREARRVEAPKRDRRRDQYVYVDDLRAGDIIYYDAGEATVVSVSDSDPRGYRNVEVDINGGRKTIRYYGESTVPIKRRAGGVREGHRVADVRKFYDYEVDVLDTNGKTYTYTVRKAQTTSAAVKKALRMHGPTATWAGNVRPYRPIAEAPRGGHRVADFNTLDDLIDHAGRELGATHVTVAGPDTRIYFPRGGQYEEAKVWRKGGYWHAEGPGARKRTSLPRGAKPILGRGDPRRAVAEAPRGAAPAGRTRLDQILDQVERGKREVTIDAEGYTPEQIDRVIAAAKARGFHVSGTRRWLLIRNLGSVGEAHRGGAVPSPAHRRTSRGAEARGEQYANDQLESDYFMEWVRTQLAEAARMPPEDVLPLETKKDAMVIAKNMLRDLEQDAKRDLQEDDAFWRGFRKALDGSREWLADELLQIKSEMGGGMREARRPTKTTKYKPAKTWKLRVVDRIVPDAGAQRVEFKDGFSIQVHGGSGRGDQLYAMRPYDMRLEQRSPGPESRREYQYAALVAVLNGRPATFLIDSDGDVRATDIPLGTSEARRAPKARRPVRRRR